MTMLANIQRGKTPRPPRLLVYGTEGIGKSTFAASAPGCIFIQTEDGLDEINCARFPLAGRYEDVVVQLTELQGSAEFQVTNIDSLDWLERLIWDRVCRDHGCKSIEDAGGGYARGYTFALTYWREIIGLLDALRARDMVITLIAHFKIEKFEDPDGAPYDRYAPRLNKHALAIICEWCDAVLFATRKMRSQTSDAGFGRKRTVAVALGQDGGERILRCVPQPSCVAKNRYGLPSEIPLSWAALMAGVAKSQEETPNG